MFVQRVIRFASFVASAAIVLLVGCRPPPTGESAPTERATRPAARPADYVGNDACVECHAEIARRYAGHPMARSLTAVSAADWEESLREPVEFARGVGRKYRVEWRDGQLRHVESGGGDREIPPYEQSESVAWSIGSGRRGRSFCLDRDGWLFMSPLSWYANGRRWDLSPEYAPEHHPRFERPTNDRCLQCHAGRLDYASKPTSELHQRYRQPTVAEAAISCERCHGPAAAHVAFHRNESKHDTADPIVHPGKLSATRANDVCNQCHLTGSAQVLRYGRHHADFRPGDLVSDIWVTFLSGGGLGREGETKAVSHVEQMQASRCFQASGGKLLCVSCHDAHSVPDETERVAYFDRRCLECHRSQDCDLPQDKRRQAPSGDSCSLCHMPRLHAHDVPHTTQTDHRVLRNPTAGDASAASSESRANESRPNVSSAKLGQNDVADKTTAELANWAIFEALESPLPEWEERRARGLIEGQAAEQQRDRSRADRAARLLRDAVSRAPDDAEALDVLAVCELLLDRPDEAVRRWEQALEIEPQRQAPLQSLMLYSMNRGETTRAAGYAKRLVEANPWTAESQGRYSLLLARLGRLDEAIVAAERARKLDPSARPATKWLIELYRRSGRSADAEKLERPGPAGAP